jgi:hypothetical protein
VAQFNHRQYEQLENAVTHGFRISIMRRGTEYTVIPVRIHSVEGREALSARHPTTGEEMTFILDEVDRFEVIER